MNKTWTSKDLPGNDNKKWTHVLDEPYELEKGECQRLRPKLEAIVKEHLSPPCPFKLAKPTADRPPPLEVATGSEQ